MQINIKNSLENFLNEIKFFREENIINSFSKNSQNPNIEYIHISEEFFKEEVEATHSLKLLTIVIITFFLSYKFI